MKTVEILDRSDMIEKMMALLELRPQETAIVTIDMHRGHLDSQVATMPVKAEDAARVIKAAKDALDFARRIRIPIIHVILVWRKIAGIGSEAMSVPFWAAMSAITEEENRLSPGRKSTIDDHNIEGSPGTAIIPELYDERDLVINNKKRLRPTIAARTMFPPFSLELLEFGAGKMRHTDGANPRGTNAFARQRQRPELPGRYGSREEDHTGMKQVVTGTTRRACRACQSQAGDAGLDGVQDCMS